MDQFLSTFAHWSEYCKMSRRALLAVCGKNGRAFVGRTFFGEWDLVSMPERSWQKGRAEPGGMVNGGRIGAETQYGMARALFLECAHQDGTDNKKGFS